MQQILHSLSELFPSAQPISRPDGFWLDAPGIDVVAMARRMAASEATLSTVTAIARSDGETVLIYHYRKGSGAINIKTITHGNVIASIAPVCNAANWIEREIQDLYAVTFSGHPNPAPLIRPPELAPGFFRRDISREPGGKHATQS